MRDRMWERLGKEKVEIVSRNNSFGKFCFKEIQKNKAWRACESKVMFFYNVRLYFSIFVPWFRKGVYKDTGKTTHM